MSTLDLILLAILLWSVLAGFAAGFTKVGIGFIASVLGILFGLWFYYIPAELVRDYLHSDTASNLFGFFAVFTVFVIAGAVVGKILGRMLKLVGLSLFDRFGGAAFGFVRGTVLVVAVTMVITAFSPQPPPRMIVESKVMPYAATASNVLSWIAPKTLKDSFRDSLAKLRKIWKESDPRKKMDIIKGGAA